MLNFRVILLESQLPIGVGGIEHGSVGSPTERQRDFHRFAGEVNSQQAFIALKSRQI
jgi:hypothetical protein